MTTQAWARVRIVLLALILVSTTDLAAQSLHGAWQIVEVHGTSSDGDWTLENVQPSLYVFLDNHYSIMLVRGEEARPLLADDATRSSISEDEMRSVFMPFVANSGKYEAADGKLTTMPMVALWPNYMEGGSTTTDYGVDGDILTLSSSDDGASWTAKLKRLE